MIHACIASYPLGSGVTPQVDRTESDGRPGADLQGSA
jgi:hypothetical protein